MCNKVPPPAALQSRWQVLTLLMDLILKPQSVDLIRLEVMEDISAQGVWNAGGNNYCWLSCSKHGALFYGASEYDIDYWELGPSVEKKARTEISQLPKQLQELIKPMRPKSLGWTFAMWSSGPQDNWMDLTGRDEECWKSAQFPESDALYGGAEDVKKWANEQLERTDIDREVGQLARFEPLTKTMATALMDDVDLDFARSAANRAGYPLESSWVK